MRSRPLIVLVTAAALLLAACTGQQSVANPPAPQPSATVPPSSALARFYAQRPNWTDCADGFFCAAIEVPLDYAKPAADAITLQLVRLPAADPSRRIGSLVVNPGGPGVSGIAYARAARQAFTSRVRAAYDIVGFDPRGVATSTPIECLTNPQQDALIAADGSPDSPAEEQSLLAISKQFADGCEAHSAALLPHVGTPDAARDMDVIRAVVGDQKLNFFGASYGTYLGATYAEEFPSKVGRFVLDGALDPTLTGMDLSKGQLGGFETALNAFLADCVPRPDCPVGPTVPAARRQIGDLLATSDVTPLRSASGRPVTQALVLVGLLFPLYSKADWEILRTALTQALGDSGSSVGDGTVLLQIADSYADRRADGTYGSNRNLATYAVNCLDRPDRATLAEFRAAATDFSKSSPIFGSFFAWSDLPCAVWPTTGEAPPHAITAVGAGPILVLGTTRDPATPYQWAVNLARQLSSGRLLTRDGDGHTAYGRGSSCIDDAVDRYLTSGTLPAAGTVCR